MFARSGERTTVAVPVDALEAVLRRRGTVAAAGEPVVLQRPLRAGDVLGARVSRSRLADAPRDLEGWLTGPVVDAVGAARSAAKAQYFAAVGPVLSSAQVDEIAAEFFDGDPEA